VVEQTLKDKGQHFVRAVAHKDLVGLQAIDPCGGLANGQGAWVGIEPQGIAIAPQDSRNSLRHPGRGWVGVLVGVELDEVTHLGLFTGDIGGQLAHHGAPERIHGLGFSNGTFARMYHLGYGYR